MPSELSRPKTRAKRPSSRPADRSRSRILSYFTVFSASSAGFGSFGTAGRRVRVDEIQRYCYFEPLVP